MTEQRIEYVGPFDTTHVVIDGRRVPFLTGTHMADRVSLTLDDRFGLDLTVAQAEAVVPFIANCIAVGLGYTCHPRADEEPNKAHPFPRMTELDFGSATSGEAE